MMLPEKDVLIINNELNTLFNINGFISQIQRISGGSINNAYSFCFNNNTFFIKINSSADFPDMFKKEVNGLKELKKQNELVIPEPVLTIETKEKLYLIMEYLSVSDNCEIYFEQLGKGLAKLHQIKNTNYGFYENNYIGSLIQINKQTASWQDFFANFRILPLAEWAFNKGYLSKNNMKAFENLCYQIDDIFPDESPCLLHGDLWQGNTTNTLKGPALFDPAVYYGHREIDIAMTRLFGGFGDSFYVAYNETYPLENDYKKRLEICNLYPLLVHAKLFSADYLTDVLSVIKKF